MGRNRHQCRWLSGWLIVALLFMQFATAAYACPAAVAAARASTAMADMPGCDMAVSMDADQPQLCKAHCQQGNQAVNPAHAGGDTASWPVLLAVLDWAHAVQLPAQPGTRPQPSGAAPPGSPPLYLTLLVLRN